MTFALEDNKKAEIGARTAPISAFYHHSLGRFSVVSVQIHSLRSPILGQKWGRIASQVVFNAGIPVEDVLFSSTPTKLVLLCYNDAKKMAE